MSTNCSAEEVTSNSQATTPAMPGDIGMATAQLAGEAPV